MTFTPEFNQPSRRRRFSILAICCLSLLIVSLDSTIVNVALPSIGRDLSHSVSGLQWTIDAYTLVLASFLMLSGSTADRVGRRKIFQLGLALFTLGSIVCSLSPNLDLLIAARMLQAVGGSMLNPVAISIITNTFSDPKERAQAFGMWGGVIGVSMAFGPIVGGLLVTSVGWRSIFWINVPVGIAAFILAGRYIPESKAPHARKVDPIGPALIILLLASLTYGIIEGPTAGWTSSRILVSFTTTVVALVALLVYEPRRTEPLIDIRFFRSVPFSGATLVAVAAFASLGGFLFLNTLYLQDSRGLSALQAGIDTLPMAVMTMIGAPISGRLVGSRGGRPSLIIAGVGMAIGSLLLTGLTLHTSYSLLFLSYIIFGIGFGVVNAPITNTAVSGMPIAQAGVAAGLASTSRQVGSSLGVAVVGALATSAIVGTFGHGLPIASHEGWWVLVGCGVLILILGVVTTSPWAKANAARTAERLMPRERRTDTSLDDAPRSPRNDIRRLDQ